MAKENIISDDLLDIIQAELSEHNHWLAYNTLTTFFGKGDMYLFKYKDEADEFAANNISDNDSFKVIYAQSIPDVIRQVLNENTFIIQQAENRMQTGGIIRMEMPLPMP